MSRVLPGRPGERGRPSSRKTVVDVCGGRSRECSAGEAEREAPEMVEEHAEIAAEVLEHQLTRLLYRT